MLFNIFLPAIAGCLLGAVFMPVRRFRHVQNVGFQPLSVAERCSSQGVPIPECEVCYWVRLSSDAGPPAYRLLSARVSVCLLWFIEFFRYRVPWWLFELVPGFQVPQR